MPLERFIGPHGSPAFRIVTEIARHAGSGMTVARFQSIRFPTGTCQVWEFQPALPPLDRPPVVVAVFLRRGRPETWTPVAEPGFDAAVRHYTERAATRSRPAGAPPAASETTPRVLPLPPGARIVAPASGKPLTLGGQPVAVTAAGGTP